MEVEVHASSMNMSTKREVGINQSKSWKPLVSCVKDIP
jgi:hypothetical protein